MGLSKEAIKEFKDIYYEEFKEKLSDAEAQEMAESFFALFKVIHRPILKRDKEGLFDKINEYPKPV